MEGKDFALQNSESFTLPAADVGPERIVLNIQEESGKGILLDEKLEDEGMTGNFLIDTYKKMNRFFLEHTKVKNQDKTTFLHLLSVMLDAGIPMVKSLKSLILQMEKSPPMQVVLKDVLNRVEAGSSLSEALLAHPNVFTEAEIGMVESGEASGQISRVLETLSEDAEKAQEIRGKVKSAMMYPTIIFCLLLLVVAAMMVYVIPKLTELFAATGGDLPLITRIVIGISDFLINNKFTLIVGIAFIAGFIILFKRTDVGRYTFDNLKLKIPVFGKLYKKSYLARFARSLGNLVDSQVSIVKSLEITANSIGNEVYRRRILLSVEDIKQGIPLAENLSESPLFPPMLVNMIEVGEKTAQLDEITAKVANFYEKELDTTISGISKIIEPIILVVVGLTVGLVVLAVMLPIVKLSELSTSL